MSIIIFNKYKFIGNGINFMNNVFFIVICGLFSGVIFGLFYQNVFLRTEIFFMQLFFRFGSSKIYKVIAYFLACIIIFLFFLYALLFSPFIPDQLWNYFYNSYFIGVVLGMFFRKYL